VSRDADLQSPGTDNSETVALLPDAGAVNPSSKRMVTSPAAILRAAAGNRGYDFFRPHAFAIGCLINGKRTDAEKRLVWLLPRPRRSAPPAVVGREFPAAPDPVDTSRHALTIRFA
jgi:hypothetical protein